jgi:predicted esterase
MPVMPGPPILYKPPPVAPQLQNVGPWRARPIMVSGAVAYRRGEFLYQDFIYDDHGASGTPDPSRLADAASFEVPAGVQIYPDDPELHDNAADFVEVRVKPLAKATAFRVTLNTLDNPEKVAFTIALGDGPAKAWPHGAGVTSPAERFVTVHGRSTDLGTVRVDRGRRQFTLRIPHRQWDPGSKTVRLAAGVGLWQDGGYSALYNVAFRTDEPQIPGRGTGASALEANSAPAAGWRESAQAAALADGDVSRFHADVDFGKLARHVHDDSAIPRTGPIDRIFASRHEYGQGVNRDGLCGRFPAHCHGVYTGRLQPYLVYVPDKPVPRKGFGLTVLAHALNENHNMYAGTKWLRDLGDRGSGYVVFTPSDRGPDGDYTDAAEANVFETWADVLRHYRIDRPRTTISGYSMGGGAVYRLMTRWPDLFARGAAGGAATLEAQTGYLPALRNNPFLSWVGELDEGTPPTAQQEAMDADDRYGLEYRFTRFPSSDHFILPANDEFGPFADFLGDHRVRRNPPHVTFGVIPEYDFPDAGVVADHAYWVSGLRTRKKGRAAIDARSEAFGVGDPKPLPPVMTQGVLPAGYVGPMAFVEREVGRGPAPRTPRRDRLVLTARNLRAATVDVRRARLSCRPEIDADTDGPLRLRLGGCRRTVVVR